MGDILTGAISGAVGTGMGLLVSDFNNRRQLEQQDRLNAQQAKYDAAASQRNTIQQLNLFNKTGYKAQVDQLKEAGLNPALMYAKGGAGGSTQAATTNRQAPAAATGGGMEITQSIAQAMQLKMLQAQIDNTKADTENKLTDAKLKGGAQTDNVVANTANTKQQTENAILDGVIKKYTGLEAKDYYEKIKVPNRGIEAKTYQDELEARQGVAETIYEMWEEGKLKDISNQQLESLLIGNAKNREEVNKIRKSIDMLDEQIKGQKLSNILDEVETQWATGTGLKSGNASGIIMKLLGALVGGVMGRGKK
ncbi:MAG: DNA pilot protein [Microviridae sp.]|nr:MAG: DNA pilot protein [Microviridae sp.]